MSNIRKKWTNWGKNQSCVPDRILYPINENDLIEAIRQSGRDNLKVKVVGSGHSFTGIALTSGVQIDLSRYNRILEVDNQQNQATIQVGKKLSELNNELWQHGLAMSNLGDIGYQTLAGALSTGTHGSGIQFGCLSTQVIAARVITGEGEVVKCSEDVNADIFQSVIVGLGAAGVLSTVTLQLEPAFNLHSLKKIEPLVDVLGRQNEYVHDNEHFQYLIYPGHPEAYTKRFNRTVEQAGSPPSESWISRQIVSRAKWLARKHVPNIVNRYPTPGPVFEQDYVGRSYSIFTFEVNSWVSNVEMEYFIPKQHAEDAIRRICGFVEQSGLGIWMPIQVRWIAGDDIPMSMCFGRESTSIAIHVGNWEKFEPYFVTVETILRDYDARPHWGKLHFLTHDILEKLYPKWGMFQKVRRILDPNGIFQNEYTDRVLGKLD